MADAMQVKEGDRVEYISLTSPTKGFVASPKMVEAVDYEKRELTVEGVKSPIKFENARLIHTSPIKSKRLETNKLSEDRKNLSSFQDVFINELMGAVIDKMLEGAVAHRKSGLVLRKSQDSEFSVDRNRDRNQVAKTQGELVVEIVESTLEPFIERIKLQEKALECYTDVLEELMLISKPPKSSPLFNLWKSKGKKVQLLFNLWKNKKDEALKEDLEHLKGALNEEVSKKTQPYEPVGDLKLAERIQGGGDQNASNKVVALSNQFKDGMQLATKGEAKKNNTETPLHKQFREKTGMTVMGFENLLKQLSTLNPKKQVENCLKFSTDAINCFKNYEDLLERFQKNMDLLDKMHEHLPVYMNGKLAWTKIKYPDHNELEFHKAHASLKSEFEYYKNAINAKITEYDKEMVLIDKELERLEPRVKELEKRFSKQNILPLVHKEYGSAIQYKSTGGTTLPIYANGKKYWFRVNKHKNGLKEYLPITADELKDNRYKGKFIEHEEKGKKEDEALFKDFTIPKRPSSSKIRKPRKSPSINLTDDDHKDPEWRPEDAVDDDSDMEML